MLTIRRLIIPSNMDLYCCFPPFKKVLQTHASRCRFATAVSRCFQSSHDLDFGSLNATRGPPLSSSQCQHFSPSRLLVTELNIDSDMVYRLCQRVTLQRHALCPSVNRFPMYCSSVRKILGRNEMDRKPRTKHHISVISSLLESKDLLFSHQ